MALRNVKVVNCKTASVRIAPWNPWPTYSFSNTQSPINDGREIKQGSIIQIDDDDITYDWTGSRKYYKVKNPKGWIHEGCIEFQDIQGDDTDE